MQIEHARRVGSAKSLILLGGALLLIAASPYAGAPVLGWLVGSFTPLYKNPVDYTWAGFGVFVAHSLAAVTGLVLGLGAGGRSRSRSGWRICAGMVVVIGTLEVLVYSLAWWGTGFVEAFPWQHPLP